MSWKFNPPPGWPPQPEGWQPPPGWAPDPAWPPAPAGWQFWVPAGSPGSAPPGSGGFGPPPAPFSGGPAGGYDAGHGSFGGGYGGGYGSGMGGYAAPGYAAGPPATKPWYQQGAVVAAAVAVAVLLLTSVVGVGTFVLLRSDGEPQAQPDPTSSPTPEPEPEPEPEPDPDEDEDGDDAGPANEGDGSGRFEGNGNGTLALELDDDKHHTVNIEHAGDGWFSAWSTRSGRDVNSLGWAYGPYSGVHVIGLYLDEKADGIRIEATGDWTVTVGDLADSPEWPDTDSGTGANVLQVDPDGGERVLSASHGGESNFIVWAYNVDRHPTLLYNEIGEFSGSAVLPAGTFVVTVEADGDWSLEER